ncbi:MAG: hypothetical protein AAGU78_08070 [Chloroflexota bacterium]
MKLRNWLLTGALVLAALLALLGPLAAGETRAQMAEPAARLRFLHAVAGGPSVDVYARKAATRLPPRWSRSPSRWRRTWRLRSSRRARPKRSRPRSTRIFWTRSIWGWRA